MNNFPNPTENGYVKSLQEAAKRTATPRVHRKDPVTTEMSACVEISTVFLIARIKKCEICF